MAAPTTVTHEPRNIQSILEKEKLNHSNFLDWHRNLRIVLKQKKKDFVLEKKPLMNHLLSQRLHMMHG